MSQMQSFVGNRVHRSEGGAFDQFEAELASLSPLRSAIVELYRKDEPGLVPRLIEESRLSGQVARDTESLARSLVVALRQKSTGSGVEGLIQEFSLSSHEGVALMCLAEALLRVPDVNTRDALIRDKISRGDWQSHVGQSKSVFVNAATWGLVLTGKLVSTNSESSLSSALTRLIARGGEPLIRKGLDMAMRMMGEQFVTGQTIEEALAASRRLEAEGFRYSYDMLGEAATTAEDAQRYYESYEQAIHAIGRASKGRGIYEGPGISIKLSALHPRYVRGQRERVIRELAPRLSALARLSRKYDIGLNIDAEEADRLDLSLDLLEGLCFDESLKGWNGIGFVVQAYQKRCPAVIDFIVDLARRSSHRIMVRLVKGAYWDTEIKRAQVDGLAGYPVFTRKIYSDISYLACARKLLASVDAVFPQFATHNAFTVAAIYHLAGENFYSGQYEFQCLHGMGEALYQEVVGEHKMRRPCRIYAPVGTHETLLAYLVRRLLENGANTSFVNRIADKSVPISELIADPVIEAERLAPLGVPHDKIPLPRDLYGTVRLNSMGMDLSNEHTLGELNDALHASATRNWSAKPTVSTGMAKGKQTAVLNPANHEDVVGTVVEATVDDVEQAIASSEGAFPEWSRTEIRTRASCLERAALAMEAAMPELMGLIVREAGKSLPNAIAEVREAVDFLRYYAAQIRSEFESDTHQALGPVVCISPWNFPLAIFTGQVAAALAAGNTVLAKPAEQTPLIAAEAVRIIHSAGVQERALQLLPGTGETVGAALVSDARIHGVMFTGSTDVARIISRTLAQRLNPDGSPVPLIAETGGQNAMIVDSSALPEQVVVDVLQSAFDSAGQRCSALRVLCLQTDIADRTIEMLTGAMRELSVGNPDRLSIDVGPVIDAEARASLEEHIAAMRHKGFKVVQLGLAASRDGGTFVPPTIIEIDSIASLKKEVFGPVLHVVRFQRSALQRLLDELSATGYGLTLGIHTRIDETIDFIKDRVHVGNVYVNRNIVGAVVGVQPFGGEGLSGTGPKAGGPLYLYRLLGRRPTETLPSMDGGPVRDEQAGNAHIAVLQGLYAYFVANAEPDLAKACAEFLARPIVGKNSSLPGPTGETNTYSTVPKGNVLCVADSVGAANAQILASLVTGNCATLAGPIAEQIYLGLPSLLRERVAIGDATSTRTDSVLFEGSEGDLLALMRELSRKDAPIVPVQVRRPRTGRGEIGYSLELLLNERALSVNTTAAGGNANLMTIV
ncbi:bifunctional protein PutA (plasmid) [Burkholderia sp. SFA1]|nr:bifunctional protein PutA [Burkholderia sp. SFA1]